MSKRNKNAAKKVAIAEPAIKTPDGMFPIAAVTPVDMVFPANVLHMMPAHKDIPGDFDNAALWRKLFTEWFFVGLTALNLEPRDGVDASAALRHIKCVMGSFEPKHEHKEAGVAWLLSQWFKGGTWTAKR